MVKKKTQSKKRITQSRRTTRAPRVAKKSTTPAIFGIGRAIVRKPPT